MTLSRRARAPMGVPLGGARTPEESPPQPGPATMDPHRAASGPPEIDILILRRCKAKDPLAFHVFVKRYERVVFSLLSRLVGHGPHVADLAQDVFLKVYVAFPEFDLNVREKPSTWLLRITTNAGIDWLRRAERRARPADLPDLTVGSTPEEDCAWREMGRAIDAAAAELSPDQLAVLLLSAFHNLTLDEIAETLGVPTNTVKTRLLRARKHMLSRLEAFLKRGE